MSLIYCLLAREGARRGVDCVWVLTSVLDEASISASNASLRASAFDGRADRGLDVGERGGVGTGDTSGVGDGERRRHQGRGRRIVVGRGDDCRRACCADRASRVDGTFHRPVRPVGAADATAFSPVKRNATATNDDDEGRAI